MGIISSLKDAVTSVRGRRAANKEYRQQLLRVEAELGARLFGEVPAGRSRKFFCLNSNTWIWHETWTDRNGQKQSVTTRYEVYPNTVIKTQNDQQMPMTVNELNILAEAAKNYYPLVAKQVYGVQVPAVS